MGLVEDLKSLEELHARGRLTDEEFADAKASAISGSKSTAPVPARPATTSVIQSPAPAKKNLATATVISRIIGLLILLFLGWVFIQQNAGNKPSSTVIKEVMRMPTDVKDEAFGVPAASWKGISIQVPYDGVLTISVEVSRGNPMQMFLTDNAGLERLKSTKQASYIGSFYSAKGTSLQHSERVRQGLYYFVVRDNSLGILSSSSSDVSLKARIAP